MSVRKAIIPAAGLGTRFLPATKASPKEMLPIVDKPLIQYAVEEAINSRIEDIIIITGRGKRAIEDHFDRSFELEVTLQQAGKTNQLREIRRISDLANFCYIRQQEALGLGHAVLCARHLIGEEPFAVILGDELIDARVPALAQLIKVYEKHKGPVIGIQRVNREDVRNYGIIACRKMNALLYSVVDLVEKPAPSEAPSRNAVIGRYVLTPEVFPTLQETKPGKNGEIQLTDALRTLAQKSPMYAREIQGTRHDAGDKLGFLKATVHYALKDSRLGPPFAAYLRQTGQRHFGPRTSIRKPASYAANPSR